MQIASLNIDGVRRYGRVSEDNFIPLLASCNPLDLLNADTNDLIWDSAITFDRNAPLNPPLPVTSIRDFITFEQHTAGSLRSVVDATDIPSVWYDAPAFYFSNPHAVIGSGHDVPIPPGCTLFDFELEVGAVISHDGYNLSPEEALNHIGGLTILNDWSARDIQQNEMQVGLGPTKGKDTASTIGPVVVTIDELADKLTATGEFSLEMSVKLNGRELGSDNLSNMAWSFAELVAYASRGTWVRRGDILGSGTAGSGCLAEFWGWTGQLEPPPLKVGDVVEMSVEKIGTITNTIINSPPIHLISKAQRKSWKKPVL